MLTDCAGTDGSETYEYAGHSANNMKTMQRFWVGGLAGYTVDRANVAGAPHDSSSVAKTAGSSRKGRELAAQSSSSIFAVVNFDKTLTRLSLLLLFAAVVGVLFEGFLYGSFGAELIPDGMIIGKWDIGLGLARYADNSAAYAFLGGVLIASSLSSAGFAVLYSLFSKTLEHERDVFSYPAVIPRRRVGGGT